MINISTEKEYYCATVTQDKNGTEVTRVEKENSNECAVE